MTKGDRDKLRAELAGKAMQGFLSNSAAFSAIADQADTSATAEQICARASISMADALMAALGIKGEE